MASSPLRQFAGWFSRTMCLLTLHATPEMPHTRSPDPADPCRQQSWCDCGKVRLRNEMVHDYDVATDGGRLCERVRVCRRCGHDERNLHHPATRPVQLVTLPPHRRIGREMFDCHYAEVCVVCDDIAFIRQRHDNIVRSWGEQCRHCGEKWYEDFE